MVKTLSVAVVNKFNSQIIQNLNHSFLTFVTFGNFFLFSLSWISSSMMYANSTSVKTDKK